MKQECYHCGLPVNTRVDYTVQVTGEARPMCCAGCQAVAQAIVDEGLESYYKHRTNYPQTPEELIPPDLEKLRLYDRKEVQQSFVQTTGQHKEATLILEGIVCAACVWLSENHVMKLPGVQQFKVNYTTHRAHVVWDETHVQLSDILHTITDIGYVAHPFHPDREQEIQQQQRKKMQRQLLVAGLGMMQAMMMAMSIYLGAEQNHTWLQFLRWASWVVATPVVLYSAQVFFIPAWRDIKARHLGMDVPVSLAILLAYSASVWALWQGSGEVYFDSVSMFVFFLLIGRFLEQGARHKAGQSIESQAKLLPAIATVKHGDTLQEVAVADVQIGNTVVVAAGEIIPVDGKVLSGQSSVDESLLTGESMPKPKAKGDVVIAGSLNIESTLSLQVQKIGADTVVASMVSLLEKAQHERPRIAQITDQVALWFVGFILLLAVGTGTYWMQQAPSEALWIVVSVLVVTCPCALSLATPVALTVATGMLGKQGLLVRRGHALETLARVDDMVFDKTGTLTEGALRLVEVECLAEIPKDEVLALAAALEAYSEHPIAKTFAPYRQDIAVEEPQVTAGKGIAGVVAAKALRIGNAAFVGHRDIGALDTEIFLADKERVLARFVLQDSVRTQAAEMVQQLKDMAITPHVFSGDQQAVTTVLAAQLKIADAQGTLLPADKLRQVQALQAEAKVVGMCGDGINDAPVLAGADVSVAMGQGTQLAKGSADMLLLSENIAVLAKAIQYARRTMAVIKQNIGWAVLYNVIALPLAMAGMVAPWMAAIGMSASSLLVVLNALRLKKFR